ncbi:hypothetical protein, partial [uncultured Ruminococcus sp.]|uniref:hypothetical protein n=1 Tax=uncultured Ruminococcus sp. TaxID=165186 RepID=UPI00292E61F7
MRKPRITRDFDEKSIFQPSDDAGGFCFSRRFCHKKADLISIFVPLTIAKNRRLWYDNIEYNGQGDSNNPYLLKMAIFRQFSAYQSWQAPARPRGLRLLVTVRYDRYRIASPLVLSPKSRLFG